MRATNRILCLTALAFLLPFLGAAGFSAMASCDQIDPISLLPANEVCSGWTQDGEPQTAYNIPELAEIINGAAFLYEQYGFVAAAFQNYLGEVSGAPSVVTLSVFNQGTSENAEALYNDPTIPPGDPVEGWAGGGAARYGAGFGYLTFQFWEECIYVSMVFTAGGEEALPDANCMGLAVVDLIQQATPAAPESWGQLKAMFKTASR